MDVFFFLFFHIRSNRFCLGTLKADTSAKAKLKNLRIDPLSCMILACQGNVSSQGPIFKFVQKASFANYFFFQSSSRSLKDAPYKSY